MKIHIYLLTIGFAFSCAQERQVEETQQQTEPTFSPVVHPEWSQNATIYELNVRQYTPEGTFNAILPHLKRIRNMGIDILWIMPIHPIGELNRKGTLGSYYSVKDYKEVNPDFGSKEDFKEFINKAHSLGFKVILDWVANHTAWDHSWMENEGWYKTDSLGNVVAPVPDWSDVAQLNYENQEVREAMHDALAYWVSEFDVDGYRCDVAGMVPTDFWNEARRRLDEIKPVFMLAEAEQEDHHEFAFDMSYGWELMHIMNEISKGEMNVNHIGRYMQREMDRFPQDGYRMYFTTNHDENSWNGTVFERYGDNYLPFAVLSSTIHGMPLVYSGQEAGLDRALEFFEKDEINWADIKYQDFFSALLDLNHRNKALWNGANGGTYRPLFLDSLSNFIVYSRQRAGQAVIVAINLGDTPVQLNVDSGLEGPFRNGFTKEVIWNESILSMEMEAHSYLILEK